MNSLLNSVFFRELDSLIHKILSYNIKKKQGKDQVNWFRFSLLFSTMLLITTLLIITGGSGVMATNNVTTMDIEAIINDDGSMDVTQLWQGTFDEGTEIYIPMLKSDYMKPSNFWVEDQLGPYEVIKNWNIDVDFNQKARKAGINKTQDGYEFCFGISQYGQNQYKFGYSLSQVIGAYEDVDGVNFRFVNDEMNTGPTEVRLMISLANGQEINAENAAIWAFGYNGQVEFNDGSIYAYSEDDLKYFNHMTVMFSLDKSILNPTRQVKGSFEEVKDRAFEGSDYTKKDDSAVTTVMVLVFFFAAFIGLFYLPLKVDPWLAKRLIKKTFDKYGYFRDINPNQSNANASYVLAKDTYAAPEGSIIGFNMMQLVESGHLIPHKEVKVSIFRGQKVKMSLEISGKDRQGLSPQLQGLLRIIDSAAGDDKILQEKELKKYSRRNDTVIRSYLNASEVAGIN